MKGIKYLFLTLLLAANFAGCDNVDFGDINTNKNGDVDPTTGALLAGSIMSYATYTGRAGLTIPTLYVQYQSQVTYTDEMQYAEVKYGWNTYYVGALNGLNTIIELNSDEANHTTELLAQGNPSNQIGVAMIMRSIIMKRVTDVYGDVPFSSAFKGLDEITPAYDTQENIYKDLIVDLKEARDMIDPSKLTISGETVRGDLIFNGNLGKWRKLANSLILQMAIQLSKVYPNAGQYAAIEFAAALSDPNGVIESVADEAWFKHKDLSGFRNPWNANRRADYFMSGEFIDALNGTGSLNPTSCAVTDPRKVMYVHHSHQARQGVPYGYRSGSGSGKAQMSVRYYWNATSSLPIMTSSYVYLNRAEAAALGWTAEVPLDMLTNGMDKSFESLTSKAAAEGTPVTMDGVTYRNARLAQIGASATLLQVIAEEKWKSLFGQAFDAWAEWRRTEIPALIPATDYVNDGNIPRRYLYPGEEASLNGTNYDDAVARLAPGDDKNTSRMWWDQ